MADIDLQKLAGSVADTLADYFESFIAILSTPRKAFDGLLNIEQKQQKAITRRVLSYTLVSIALGLCLAAVVKLPGSPDIASPSSIIGLLCIWFLCALVLHPLLKLFKAKGTVFITVTVVLYVISTLHIILIPITAVLSKAVTDTVVTLDYEYVVYSGPRGEGYSWLTPRSETYIKEEEPEKEGTVLPPVEEGTTISRQRDQTPPSRVPVTASPWPLPTRAEQFRINKFGLLLSLSYYLLNSFYLSQGLSVAHNMKRTLLMTLAVLAPIGTLVLFLLSIIVFFSIAQNFF